MASAFYLHNLHPPSYARAVPPDGFLGGVEQMPPPSPFKRAGAARSAAPPLAPNVPPVTSHSRTWGGSPAPRRSLVGLQSPFGGKRSQRTGQAFHVCLSPASQLLAA